ncbi:MAG: hypothetical protein WC415_00600 [Patescibacteria group bacterium]|jgi:hypothetical protein
MINDKLGSIFKELFYALTVFLVVLAVLELLFSRMVLAYINLSYLLLVWLIIGIILLVISKKKLSSP